MKKIAMKKPALNFDLGNFLLFGAMVFQSYQFGRALNIYDPEGWSFQGVNIGGLFLGGIVNAVVAMAAKKLPSLTAAALKSGKQDKKSLAKNERKMQKAQTQARFAQAAFYILLTLSPLLVAPAMYLEWLSRPLPPILIGFLAVGWASAPDLTIALGGFVAGKSFLQMGDAPASHSAKSATDSPSESVGRAKKSVAGATESATSATQSVGQSPKYPRTCEHCATDSPFAVLKSANAVGGHMKKHHPELCKTNARATLAENLFSKVDA